MGPRGHIKGVYNILLQIRDHRGDPELIWLDDVVGGDENSPLKGFRPSYQQTSDASLEIRRIFSSDDVAHGWVTILNNVIYITTLDVKRPVRLGDKNDPQDDS